MQISGSLPDHGIEKLIADGAIVSSRDTAALIQPASMDLTVGSRAWRVESSQLPRRGQTIEEIISRYSIYEVDLSEQRCAVLERVPYIVELEQKLKLPANIRAHTNNKSSTGRVDVSTRLLANGVEQFDSIPVGYDGAIYAEVNPNSFMVHLFQGVALNQIRFFSGEPTISDEQLYQYYRQYNLFFDSGGKPIPIDSVTFNRGLVMTVDLSQKIAGWRARRVNRPLVLNKIATFAVNDFWDPISASASGEIELVAGDFYIFCTREWIRVPPIFSVEMSPLEVAFGEFRSHYAGFFDPGFGYGKEGEILGTPAVLEVRAYNNNLTLHHGQPICVMRYEHVLEKPRRVYGADIGSNYHVQRGLTLSKIFKPSS